MILFEGFLEVVKEIGFALLPIVIIFLLLQAVSLRVSRGEFKRIMVGFVITFIGLVLFMQGVNVAFTPVGSYLGNTIGASPYKWLLVPIGLVMGFLTAFAEPAVQVMVKQVEDITSGALKARVMLVAISIGVALAVSLSMVRLLVGFTLWWYIIPGYALVLILSRFVDPIFVGMAYDNGGVATGPMCSTFILAFSVGIATVLPNRDPLLDGFGIIALIALAPILTTLLLGFVYKKKKSKKTEKSGQKDVDEVASAIDTAGDSV